MRRPQIMRRQKIGSFHPKTSELGNPKSCDGIHMPLQHQVFSAISLLKASSESGCQQVSFIWLVGGAMAEEVPFEGMPGVQNGAMMEVAD